MNTHKRNRSVSRFLLVLAALPVLALVLLSVFITWFDADNLHTRQQLQNLFRETSGYNLKLAGKLELSFQPSFRLVANHVEIVGPAGIKLFSASKLGLETDPFSLIKGKLQFDQVTLENADITLTRQADGGWAIPHKQVDKATQHQRTEPVLLPVNSVTFHNSRVSFVDNLTARQYSLDDININLRRQSPDSLQLTAAGNVHISGFPQGLIAGTLKTAFSIYFEEQIRLAVSALRADLYYADQPLDFQLAGKAVFSNTGQFIQAEQVELSSSVHALKATINSQYHYEKQKTEIDIEQFNLASALTLFSKKIPIKTNGESLQNFSAHLDIQHNRNDMEIDIPSLQIDDVRAQGRLALQGHLLDVQLKIDELKPDTYLGLITTGYDNDEQSSDHQTLKANIKINRLLFEEGNVDNFSLGLLIDKGQLQTLELATEAIDINPALLLKHYTHKTELLSQNRLRFKSGNFERLQGNVRVNFNREEGVYQLNNLDISLDDTTVKGSILYNHLNPGLQAQLHIGRLDLDRYEQLLKGVQENEPADAMPSSSSQTGQSGYDQLLDSLKKLKGSGSLQIDWLKYQGHIYQNGLIQFNDA